MSSRALSKNEKFQPARTTEELNKLYAEPSAGTEIMTMENTLQKLL